MTLGVMRGRVAELQEMLVDLHRRRYAAADHLETARRDVERLDKVTSEIDGLYQQARLDLEKAEREAR